MDAAEVIINGRSAPLADVPVWTTALDFLREQGLTGCKEGCAEGECGACSVLIARPGVAAPTEWVAINACLVPIAALDGQEVITSEGLGDADALHPVQYEMAVRGGSQCGYCTPGFICSMAGEYYRPNRAPANGHSDAERGPNGFDLHALSGNLCRCTGYRPIRDAAYALGEPADSDALAARSAQPAPPPVATRLRQDGLTFTRPADLAEAVQILHERPETTVLADLNLGFGSAPVDVERHPQVLRRQTHDHANLPDQVNLPFEELHLAVVLAEGNPSRILHPCKKADRSTSGHFTLEVTGELSGLRLGHALAEIEHAVWCGTGHLSAVVLMGLHFRLNRGPQGRQVGKADR